MPIVAIDVTTKNEWEGPRELVRPWGSGVGSAVHCSGVMSDNGPAVNGPAVTSRNCVLDLRKNETLDVVTSKERILKWILKPTLISFHDKQEITHCDFMSPETLTLKFLQDLDRALFTESFCHHNTCYSQSFLSNKLTEFILRINFSCFLN